MMDNKHELKKLITSIDDPVLNIILESLLKLYKLENIKKSGNEFLMICDGIKISICFTEDHQNIEIISIESNGNKKYYQICYKGEIIELNRRYEKFDEIVVRRQKFKNNLFKEEEYTKYVNSKKVQKTIAFLDDENTIYLCTEYNNNPRKYCEVTTEMLSFNYTDLAVVDYVPDFIVYDSLIKGQYKDSLIRPITLSEFNKKYYYACREKNLDRK